MGSLDRGYSDGFYSSQRSMNPEAGPTMTGELIRAAVFTPVIIAGAFVAIGAERLHTGAKALRAAGSGAYESVRRFAQDMGDDGEGATEKKVLPGSVVRKLLDKAASAVPINVDVNPIPLVAEAKGKVRGLGLLSAIGVETWRAVDHTLEPAQVVPTSRVRPEQPISFQRRK